jgi:6-pyruvoyltetrahydropterin/6-carboxytetrahydropterin synthase
MFAISKRFEFSASHVLAGLPDGHQCGRLHGHNYGVEIEVAAARLDSRGFVVDYGELASVKEWIDATLDHRHLNDVMADNPTAEHLARWLFNQADALLDLPAGTSVAAVRVMETPKTVAEYRL